MYLLFLIVYHKTLSVQVLSYYYADIYNKL